MKILLGVFFLQVLGIGSYGSLQDLVSEGEASCGFHSISPLPGEKIEEPEVFIEEDRVASGINLDKLSLENLHKRWFRLNTHLRNNSTDRQAKDRRIDCRHYIVKQLHQLDHFLKINPTDLEAKAMYQCFLGFLGRKEVFTP